MSKLHSMEKCQKDNDRALISAFSLLYLNTVVELFFLVYSEDLYYNSDNLNKRLSLIIGDFHISWIISLTSERILILKSIVCQKSHNSLGASRV